MRRVLTLEGPDDAVLYRYLVFAFLSAPIGERSRSAIYQTSRIKKALFACGEILEVPLQARPDDDAALRLLHDPAVLIFKAGQAIRLRGGPRSIDLYQDDWNVLIRAIESVQIGAAEAEEVADLLDRISAAEVHDERHETDRRDIRAVERS